MGPRLQGDRALVRDEPDAADDHRRPAAGGARLPGRADGAELHRLPRRPLPARPRRGLAGRRRGRQVLRAATPTRLGDYEAWLRGVADVLAPLLLRTPPRVGSRRPGDLLDQLRMAWGMRGLDVRGTAEATRLFTMSIADVLDEWFESPEVKGVLAINGIIGTWAGPEEPGTAYVMMHHTIGDVGDGQLGSWGYPIGGMGAVSDAIRRAAESFGADVRTSSPVERIDVADGARARRRRPATGGCCGRRSSSPRRIRRSRSCARSTPPSCRPTSSHDLRRWRSRSGTVKVNVALVRAARLPRLARHRAARAVHRLGRAVPLDRLPPAGVPGRPRGPGRRPPVLRRRDPLDARPDALPRTAPT